MEFPDVELEAHTGEKISPARVPKAVVGKEATRSSAHLRTAWRL